MRASLAALVVLSLAACREPGSSPAVERPSLLFITVDDMSCDSVGAFGCPIAGTTPTIDRLAAESLRFAHAHVQVANCMPSRNVMFSGRYPHNNRVEGFEEVRDPDYPVLADLLQRAGWFTAIRGKVAHTTPYVPYPAWDLVLDRRPDGGQEHPKDVASYYRSTQQGIAAARAAGKPFYLNINISDPHRPFHGEGSQDDANPPSRVFTADEVPVPGFLPDDRVIREELVRYYSSVRRADDCLAGVLRALDESGQAARTLVVFLSDHGMPLPFVKTQLYYHSTRTPLVVRWPGVTAAGAVDVRHLVSGVDLLPTLLDALELPHPPGLDGRSFEPLLRGEAQDGRDYVVAEYNESVSGARRPMRAIVTREYGYLFNPWSDGVRRMESITTATATYRRMQELAATDPHVAARLDLLDHRVPEELYRYAVDPDALDNLVDRPEHREELERLTKLLEQWMAVTNDPLLQLFRGREDPAVREAYMASVARARGR